MADIVTQFGVKLWEGKYWCHVRFPDGFVWEGKSDTDLTYAQWQEKISAAWSAHITPPPAPLDEVRAAIIKVIQAAPTPIDKPKLVDSIVAAVEPWLRT